MLSRGRVIKADAVSGATTVVRGAAAAVPRGRSLDRSSFEARREAERLVNEARQRASEIVAAAERQCAKLQRSLEDAARQTAAADVAALSIALREREARLDERGLERSVQLATLLAERLLGKALELDPGAIADIARQTLAEARGAGTIRLLAHPDDAAALESRFGELGLAAATLSIVAEPGRARGSLRVETELGVLDAALSPQLERLAAKLREVLQHGV